MLEEALKEVKVLVVGWNNCIYAQIPGRLFGVVSELSKQEGGHPLD